MYYWFKGAIMFKNSLLVILTLCSLEAKTIYVNHQNQTKSPDGTTWDSAFKSLKNAIKNAQNGDDIWIATGEYIINPVRLNNINVYGGFRGDETQLERRDIVNNETKIFGRIALENAMISAVTILQKPEDHKNVSLTIHSKRPFNIKKPRPRPDNNEDFTYLQEDIETDDTLETEQGISAQALSPNRHYQQENEQRVMKTHPKPTAVFERFDQNRDGQLSKNEAPPPLISDWNYFDTNQDGMITLDEMKTPPPNKGHRPPQR